jgi:hypothetical protein
MKKEARGKALREIMKYASELMGQKIGDKKGGNMSISITSAKPIDDDDKEESKEDRKERIKKMLGM